MRDGAKHVRTGGAAPLALALVVLATPAGWAQDDLLPTLFDVAGVAAGDVLNVRAAPDPAAEIVGRLAADATGVEVVGLDPTGGWGQVNAGGRSGWAAMRYLAPRAGLWDTGALPPSLRCFGTEPFWSLAPEAGGAVFSTPDDPERTLDLAAVLDSGITRDPRRALIAEGDGLRLTASITPAACSDGMSDRAFGLSVMVVAEAESGPALLTGCCSVAP